MSAQPVIAYRGKVELRLNAASPLGVKLVGRSADTNETACLSFVGAPPPNLPSELHDPTVHRIDAASYRLAAGERAWTIPATGIHLHRDVSEVFYRAVPPRPVPLSKRIFWRVIVGLAATPLGRALLARRGR